MNEVLSKLVEEVMPLPKLVEKSDTFRLYVPAKVEEKIRYLIRKFPHTEWSGVLFYTHTGSFENKDLEIHCEDIYPMDLGTSGWTEFHMSEDVTSYMAENIELFDCELGLCHSHHSLGAFISGQDSKMLQQEGNDTNCFVSLVVDTRGQYVAAVTRKIQTKSEIITRHLGKSYQFFGDGEVKVDDNTEETKQNVDEEVIEYFMLDVQRQVVDNPLEYLDIRFNEIEEKKRQKSYSSESEPNSIIWNSSVTDFIKEKNERPAPKQLNIWDNPKQEKTDEQLMSLYDWQPNKKLIHNDVIHMITCSLSLKTDGFDLKSWITKHMVKMYEKMFGAIDTGACERFDIWCDFIIEFLVYNYIDTDESSLMIAEYDEDAYHSIIAQAFIEELDNYDSNVYIDKYIETLQHYLM